MDEPANPTRIVFHSLFNVAANSLQAKASTTIQPRLFFFKAFTLDKTGRKRKVEPLPVDPLPSPHN